MNKTVYKQTDERWRWWVYPKKGWYLNGCGCGCLSIFHCAIELPKYKKQTVMKVMKPVYEYMKQYATCGNGTYRVGITNALKHFGFEEVTRNESKPMSYAFERLNKGSRVGVIVFVKTDSKGRTIPAVGPDGTCWTTGGHYIAFTAYKVQNGKHYFYMKDSAGRNHSGWYCYETSMRGCVADIWTAKIPEEVKNEKPKNSQGENSEKSSKPALPNIEVKETKTINNADKVLDTAKRLAWPKGTDSKKYAFNGGAPTSAFKKAYDRVFPKHNNWGKGPKTGASCDSASATVIRDSGLDPSMPRGRDELRTYKPSKNFERVVYHNRTPYSVSKPGDMLVYDKNEGGSKGHVLIRGEGCLYEAQYQKTYFHRNGSLSKIKKSMPRVVVFRPKTTKKTVTRKYLMKGDKGEEVKKLQVFLNWYGNYGLIEDGDFGNKTEEAVKAYQTKVGCTTATGKFGEESLKFAKAVN